MAIDPGWIEHAVAIADDFAVLRPSNAIYRLGMIEPFYQIKYKLLAVTPADKIHLGALALDKLGTQRDETPPNASLTSESATRISRARILAYG